MSAADAPTRSTPGTGPTPEGAGAAPPGGGEPRPADGTGHTLADGVGPGRADGDAPDRASSAAPGPAEEGRPGPADSAPGRARRHAVALAAAVLAAVAALALAVATATGGAPGPTALDAGPLVRHGLPAAELLSRLAATVTIGALALTVAVLPPAFVAPARRTATWSAWAWAAAQTACLPLTALDVLGATAGAGRLDGVLAFTGTAPGSALVWSVVLTCVTAAVVTGPWRGRAVAGLVLALLALVPLASGGHAGAHTGGHTAASALWLHLGAVTVWAGGVLVLAGLGLSGGTLPGRAPSRARAGHSTASARGAARPGAAWTRDAVDTAVRRFSPLALWCFVVVAGSGVVVTLASVDDPADLPGTGWGRLLLAKTALFLLLGVAGWAHRRRLAARAGRAVFLRLALGEAAVMAATLGVAVALADSPPPPAPQGTPLPPLTPETAFTAWSVQPVAALAALGGAVLYVRWAWRLRRRGDSWPVARTAVWLTAMALLLWVTNGGPAAYGHTLLSVHMMQHMMLATVLPVLYVLASPVTLALRALPARADSSAGPRERLQALLGSRWARVLLHPAVATANVVVSMALFYATPLFRLSLTSEVVHLAAALHFSVAGYLFVVILVDTDPVPHRPSYPLRLAMLAPGMVFHTALGLTLVTSSRVLLAPSVLAAVEPAWLADRLTDQQAAGALVWALGEVPALALALVIASRWAAADERDERRAERRAARAAEALGPPEPAGAARTAGTTTPDGPRRDRPASS
ncbi:cytochrome c oxidase assembly protein [Xylanimonas oleitrophica]|uniref:cytochrome c oxidase assembly protein n=1 Tax=Xylanimonas oleitrophica TaxID=2607479 RepID=UPI0011B5419A|nr:cytochrome c oxidase assembly protein [Xylanimonas oleitrophica]